MTLCAKRVLVGLYLKMTECYEVLQMKTYLSLSNDLISKLLESFHLNIIQCW